MKRHKYYYKPKLGVPLSPKELKIIRMMCMDNATIAYRHHTTVGVIKQLCNHIYLKLGVKNRAEAVITAIRQGLMDVWDVVLPTDVY